MNSVILMLGLAWAEPAAEDTAAVEDTATDTAADTSTEDTAVEDTASIEDTASLDDTFADTGDTADTADTSTGSTDTTDTTTTEDSSDTSELVTPASSLAGEKGGYGCATVGFGGVLAIWVASFAIGFRREKETS